MKPPVLIAALLLLASCNSLFSQSIFQFKYNYGKDDFESLVVRYDDGSGFMRVRDDDNLIELELIEEYYKDSNGVIDSSVLVMHGTNPRVITGRGFTEHVTEYFWFKENPSDGYFDPWVVQMYYDDTMEEGKFTHAILLSEEQLTKDLVLDYFTEKEDFYSNLFEANVRPLSPKEKQTKLHLVVVANTEVDDIGATCTRDKDRAIKTFGEVAEYMGIQLKTKIISGKDYNKTNVELAIQNLHPSTSDIVVFYYTGHGFSKNDNRQFPNIELRSKSFEKLEEHSMNMEDIYNAIVRKGARVNLVMSDCCNSDPGAISTINGDIAQTRGSSIGWSQEICRSLFLPERPVSILVSAASKGEMSAGNLAFGGFFSYHFKSSMDQYLNPFNEVTGVTWVKIVEDAKNQTIAKALRTTCKLPDGSTPKCTQHPVYKIQEGK